MRLSPSGYDKENAVLASSLNLLLKNKRNFYLALVGRILNDTFHTFQSMLRTARGKQLYTEILVGISTEV